MSDLKNTPEGPAPEDPENGNGNGGVREGAGRKAGGQNRRTIANGELRDKLLRTGETPLEVMVDGMRKARKQHAKAADKIEAFDLDTLGDADTMKALAELLKSAAFYLSAARDCAKDAAPYLHPRMEPMGRFIEIELPVIKSADDVSAAHDAVLAALASGELTTDEGARIASILDSRRRVIETAELAQRIEALEAKLK